MSDPLHHHIFSETYLNGVEYYSSMKKRKRFPTFGQMNLEISPLWF
jgi:hypothetical protein